MPMHDKVNIVLFSGGRGASSIAAALVRHSQTTLTMVVNGYDDGLSTGRVRAFVPGMLGPSDFRKSISTLMPEAERRHRALKIFLDHRLPRVANRAAAMGSLQPIANGSPAIADPTLAEAYLDLSVLQAQTIGAYCRAFLRHEGAQHANGNAFDYSDCCVGNLLLAGCFIESEHDFNRAVAGFSGFCEARGKVLNITDGRNYVLTALKKDGVYLHDEETIVSPQDDTPIQELFLLDDYLPEGERRKLQGLPLDERFGFLRERSRTPCAHTEAIESIAAADLIIYGPGTQHSSLFPSYVTNGVAEAIMENERAEKVFVANLYYDNDIQHQTVEDLIANFRRYMSRKEEPPKDLGGLITRVFPQHPDRADVNRDETDDHVPFDSTSVNLPPGAVLARDWEGERGRHAGGWIADELLSLVQELTDIKLRPYRHTVSIVMPALNEARTVQKVLRDVRQVDFHDFDVSKEMILVDGGSSDETLALARQEKRVRVYSLEGASGRGAALRFGVSKARGNVIVFFPTDGEYEAEDIALVVEPILKNQFNIVFGSRAIKCVNLDEHILHIYRGNRVAYLISKYGGALISILSLLFCKRFVTDPFSTLKGFDLSLLRRLDLRSNGVDLETEIIAKANKHGEFILEVPVQYTPRTKAEGKKMTVRAGLKALLALVFYSFRPAGAVGTPPETS